MKKILLIICIISTTFSFAKKWDAVYINKLITKGDIDKVIQHYQDGYYSSNRNPQDAFKIAELYVKKKDYASAMQWYDKEKQLINSSKVNLFNYANTNRLMGEYQKALDGYLMYAANTGDAKKVMDFANQCEKILKLSSQATNYKLDNYTYNTSNNETNVALLRTNAIYTTTNTNGENQTTTINQVVRSFQNFGQPVKAYQNNIPNIIITSLSYSKDGNKVVFSAKEVKPSTKKNTKNIEKIYTAKNLAGNFLEAKILPFNYDGFSFKNPSFNDDATTVYFSSNLNGGSGGFDIWKSNFENGKWSLPINLGKLINTKSDEINPFIVQDGNENLLYFSSDRTDGFGGFDIYTAKKSFNIWQDVEMQPAPINSAGDDVSIVYDNEVKSGYFTSNRKGGKGGFDLYRYTPFNLRIIINTIDSATKKPIDYAYTQLNENGAKAIDGVTNENGKAIFQVGKDKTFKINISKDGYRPVVANTTSIGKANGDSVVIEVALKKDDNYSVLNGTTNDVSMDNYTIFTGHVIDGATNKPALNTKMRMVNYTTQKVRELDLDKSGKFEIKLLQNNNYKIIFVNQSHSIFDELTSYGLEKNDIKVRDYLLSGGKFKLTQNKVYKDGNLPANIKIGNSNTSNVSVSHEPITQSKIDSLLKVIVKDNPEINPTTTTKKQAIASPEIPKTEIAPKATLKKDIEKQTPRLSINAEKEKTVMAADIITKNNNKKIKILNKVAEKNNIIDTIALAPKSESVAIEKSITTNKEKIVQTKNTIQTKKEPIIETPKAIEVAKETVNKVEEKAVVKVEKIQPIVETPKAIEVAKETASKVEEKAVVKAAEIQPIVETPKAIEVAKTTAIKVEEKAVVKAAEIQPIVETPKAIEVAKETVNKVEEKAVVKAEKIQPIVEMPKAIEVANETANKVEEKAVVKSEEIQPIVETPKAKEVKPTTLTEIKKPKTEAISAEELPDNYFKIQLASYDEKNLQFPEFANYGKVEMVQAYDRYIYRLGIFTDLDKAKQVLDEVRAKGYFVAFILQYKKDKVTGIVK